jgi:PAS domain S-box-containing protein
MEVAERSWVHVVLTGGVVAIAILLVLRLRLDHRLVHLAEEGVRRSDERLRSLVQHTSDLIAVLDARGALSYVAPSSERLFGVSPDLLTGRSVLDVVHPDDVPLVRSTFARSRDVPNATGGIELRVRDREDWRWVEVRYTNLLHDPVIRGVVLNVRDLTDRHAAQTALLEREAQYRSLFEKNQAVMLLVDPVTDDIADANPAAAEFYGYPVEQLRGMNIAHLRADAGDVLLDEMRRAQAEQRSFWLLRHRLANGLIRPVEVYSGSIAIGGESLTYEIVHDITERRLAEDALRDAEERFRTLVEQLPVVTYLYGFYRTDPSRTMPGYVGPQISKMLGVSPQEWLAGDGLWASMVHPDDLDRASQRTAARLPQRSTPSIDKRRDGNIWSATLRHPHRERRRGRRQASTRTSRAASCRRGGACERASVRAVFEVRGGIARAGPDGTISRRTTRWPSARLRLRRPHRRGPVLPRDGAR